MNNKDLARVNRKLNSPDEGTYRKVRPYCFARLVSGGFYFGGKMDVNRFRRVMWLVVVFVFIACLMARCGAEEVKHFKAKEFACKCCGKVVIDNTLISRLEKLRHELGDMPIVITSGYRCPFHNKATGGAKRSQHCQGKAVDIKVAHYTPQEVAHLAKMVGFTWVRAYRSWTHVDIR
jgi:hypothetical protein